MIRSDLTGQKFGRLTAISQAANVTRRGGGSRTAWNCKCNCGNSAVVVSHQLVAGTTQSCGCYQVETRIQSNTIHGQCSRGCKTTEFNRWNTMIQRCTNPNSTKFYLYGGRGITIEDPRWYKFQNFYVDMGKCPKGKTLDRIDNSRGYCKENCEWRTPKQQSRNKRNNHLVEYRGKSMCLTEACELTGQKGTTIYMRMYKYWHCTFEEALTKTLIVPKHWTAAAYRKKLDAFMDDLERSGSIGRLCLR
jgi:hypothetical protein